MRAIMLREYAPTRAWFFTLTSSSTPSADLKQKDRLNAAFARQIYKPKLEAVCRAGWRGERNRCAVRMTARGSVTPGMACGSRPVERIPELGAFPTVGIRQGPGLPRGRPFPPWPAPANSRLAYRPSRQGGTGSIRIKSRESGIDTCASKSARQARNHTLTAKVRHKKGRLKTGLFSTC